jgi:hypothetical protein
VAGGNYSELPALELVQLVLERGLHLGLDFARSLAILYLMETELAIKISE